MSAYVLVIVMSFYSVGGLAPIHMDTAEACLTAKREVYSISNGFSAFCLDRSSGKILKDAPSQSKDDQ